MVQGVEFTYLWHYPRWGSPRCVAWVPAWFGFQDPNCFNDAGLIPREGEMKRPKVSGAGFSAFLAPVDDIVEKVPLLAEFLASTHYDGEAPGTRQVGSLLLFAQDGVWKVCLRDKDLNRCLWLSMASLSDVWAVCEDGLGSELSVWREDRAGGAEQAKRIPPTKRT